MRDKITIDVLEHDKGWVEYWQCLKCGKLFPLHYLSCPYCDPNKGRASVTCETYNYESSRGKEDNRQLDC